MNLRRRAVSFLVLAGLCLAAASCDFYRSTFSQGEIEQSIKDICLKDYGISGVEVKVVGRTIGVHLPLRRLFVNDVQSVLLAGKIKDLENLLQLSEDAIEKIQDVIFTTSRVIMSSDKPIDFYVVKATDMEQTGLEFVMANHIQDVKEVRFWNIPLSEYYKRSFRDLRLNRTLFFKRPVLEMFKGAGTMDTVELLRRYFASESSLRDISPFFYTILMEYPMKKDVETRVLDARSKLYSKDEVLVYAKVKETYHPKPAYAGHRFVYPSGAVLEYLFVLTASKEGYKISRVLPFHYVAPDGRLRKVEFPGDLKLYQNIETWPGDFEVEEIMLDEFLASQAGQRMQGIFSQDKKILEQFDEIKAGFSFFPPYRLKEAVPALAKLAEGKPKEFRCRLELKPKENLVPGEGAGLLEDPRISYALSETLGEFAEIMHGYGFKDYESLKIEVVAPGETAVFEIARPLVEKFYKKRIALKDILKPVSTPAEASLPEPNSG